MSVSSSKGKWDSGIRKRKKKKKRRGEERNRVDKKKGKGRMKNVKKVKKKIWKENARAAELNERAET